MHFFDELLQAILHIDTLKVVSVVCALAFAWLAGSQNKNAFIFGLVNIGIAFVPAWTDLSLAHKLVGTSTILASVYGVYAWSIKPPTKIKRLISRGGSIELLATLTFGFGLYWLVTSTSVDISIYKICYFTATILAVYYTAKKVLEVWIIWAIIYVANLIVSFYAGNVITFLVTALYIPLTIRGLYLWTHQYFYSDDDIQQV